MQRAWADPRVVNLSWYVWRDEPVGRNGSAWQSGLFYADGRPKPAYAAFELPFAATTTRVWGQVRPGTTHRVSVEARPASGAYQEIASVQTDARGGFAQAVRAPSWARYVRARVVDNAAGAGPVSLPVLVRRG